MKKTDLGWIFVLFALAVLFGTAGTAVADLIWPVPEPLPLHSVPAVNYLVLVSKEHPVPEFWEASVDLVRMTNSLGEDVAVEAAAYDAYLGLKEALAEEDIFVDISSGYRNAAEQQKLIEDLTERYGEDYVKQYAAEPGYSEHQTGLALDLYLLIDGKAVDSREDPVNATEIWEKVHAKLAEFGFILRYPEGKEDITGYGSDPRHIRYVGDPETAKEITEKGLTLEEFSDRS